MSNNEKRLSDYIDSLNEEMKPREHDSTIETPEMEELLNTVRLVRSLKEASLPENEYHNRVVLELNKQLSKKKASKSPRKNWFLGAASAAAGIALIFALNSISPFGTNRIVHAMEKAYEGVKAYHGILEIIETNGEGKSATQSKVEVWADKEGRYYVKGLEGSQKDLITVNDGQKKWQVQPEQKEVNLFSAFPDTYSFTFEIGEEIDDVKDSIKTKSVGEEMISGRAATIIEVTPQGGSPYTIWIDKETKMPLQKQSAMQYSLQYKAVYTKINFSESIPKELLAYSVPNGFKEINSNPEQLLNNLEEAEAIIGFTPKLSQNVPAEYSKAKLAVESKMKIAKTYYSAQDNKKKVSVLQRKAVGEFKPASMGILGKVNSNIAEIQAPIQQEIGILGGSNYADSAGLNSIRWQQEGFEYAVVGNITLEELTVFIKGITNGSVELATPKDQSLAKSAVEVTVDLKSEESDQKNADSGHSLWKLDPIFTAQVFVSLKISPEGIKGEYPIKLEELKVIQNDGKEAVVEVSGNKTPIKRVYLKRVIRQDATGIWTVTGYDPVS